MKSKNPRDVTCDRSRVSKILSKIVALLKNSFRYSDAKLFNRLSLEAKVARLENVFKLNLS